MSTTRTLTFPIKVESKSYTEVECNKRTFVENKIPSMKQLLKEVNMYDYQSYDWI